MKILLILDNKNFTSWWKELNDIFPGILLFNRDTELKYDVVIFNTNSSNREEIEYRTDYFISTNNLEFVIGYLKKLCPKYLQEYVD